MNTNQDRFTGLWPELKGQVRQHWGKLTADDLTPLNGTIADLISVLRQRYGYGQAQAAIEIDRWLNDLHPAPIKN
jgi:uncharacterized protein YjbJ (UPF0337 family)